MKKLIVARGSNLGSVLLTFFIQYDEKTYCYELGSQRSDLPYPMMFNSYLDLEDALIDLNWLLEIQNETEEIFRVNKSNP